MKNSLSHTRCFLLDMDGTFYLGDKLLPGAREFIDWAKANNKQFIFLTNNSSKSKKAYREKLKHLGFDLPDENFFTSGEATIIYLKKHYPNRPVWLCGTPALEKEFESHGIPLINPQRSTVNGQRLTGPAVLAFDTTLTYAKLAAFCDVIRTGVPYIATHPDFNCPTETGFVPDTGSFIELIAASTGRRPDVVIGKPNRHILDALVEKIHIPLSQIAMIGDRLYTDIALGQHGVTTVLVLSGETKAEEVSNAKFKPTVVTENLLELVSIL